MDKVIIEKSNFVKDMMRTKGYKVVEEALRNKVDRLKNDLVVEKDVDKIRVLQGEIQGIKDIFLEIEKVLERGQAERKGGE